MIKNKRNIYITIILILFFIFNLFTELRFYGNRLDFYWNFNFGLQISNGLLPYNDFNIVTTPLLAFITGIVLKIFGKSIIVYSILMALFKVIMAFITAYIASKMNSKTKDNKQFIISFILANLVMYRYYFEYNFLAILFLIVIILIENKVKKNPKEEVIIGILSGLAILSKHSVGMIILLFILIKPLLFKEKKENILYRLIGLSIPTAIFIIYLLGTNSLYSFISYTILGLKEFNNNTVTITGYIIKLAKYKNIKAIIIYLSILILCSLYIINCIYNIIKKKKRYTKEEKQVLYYSIAAFGCFYPIMDDTHLFMSIMPISILISISITKIINNNIVKNKLLFKILKNYAIVIILISVSFPVYKYIEVYTNNNKNYVVIGKELSHLEGLVIEKGLYDHINEIIEYEKEEMKNGYIIKYLDENAILMHLPEDIYYKDYDLFMRGNFGENGEDRIIEDIKNSQKTKYLIKKDYVKTKEEGNSSQVPIKIIDYVINNYQIEGTKNNYIIYSK